ncbi:hypothetical protein GOV12_05610 [Candidatus Pacearchaeota archaeon]|nr:hypothetical protein [Candidatus Pacearchaeota archaeon]
MTDIKKLLEEKGVKVIGYSDIGVKINEFDSWISDELFTFLVNNQLNRYLFNVFMRVGSLEIDDWPFNMDLLISNKIKEKVKESFIKKFVCGSCGQILLNEVSVNIGKIDDLQEIECPNCKIKFDFNYKSLEDSFIISKRVLSEYLEQLASRDVIKIRYIKHCPSCRDKKIFDKLDEKDLDLKCNKCNNFLNLNRDYSFNDNFLSYCLMRRGGEWFEWYVYKLCSYMHEEVDHNILIEVEEDGIKKELEIDVIGRDDDKLTIYECKDTKNKSDWKDFESLPYLTEKFENVKIVNSYDSNRKVLQKISELCNQEIINIKGSDLEDNFMGVEPTILRLKSKEWPYNNNGVKSFSKLANEKKLDIIHILLEEINFNEESTESLFAFIKIAEDNPNFIEFLSNNDQTVILEKMKIAKEKIESKELKNFKDRDFSCNIINFMKIVITTIEKDKLLEEFSISDIFNICQDTLKGDLGEDLIDEAYNYYDTFFSIFNDEIGNLNTNNFFSFFDAILPILNRYNSWNKKTETFQKIRKIASYLDRDRTNNLVLKLKENISTYSWSVNWEIVEICKKIYNNVDRDYKKEIKDILRIMSEVDEEKSNTYAIDGLKKIF